MPRLLIGHVTDTTAKIWVRGSERNPVAFVEVVDSQNQPVAEKKKRLEERHFFTGVLDFGGLTPRRVYYCRVTFGRGYNTPADSRESPPDNSGRFRTFPAADSSATLNFIFGSCNLHTLGLINPADPAYRRLAQKAEDESADFMLHCGDQIYYDRPQFNREPSIEAYRGSYLDAWDDSREARKFLTALPHYMILDDHEIRDNFRNDLLLGQGTIDNLKDTAIKVYREFQHLHNPDSYGSECLYYDFSFAGVHFFVLDTRTERWRDGQSQMIGEQQLERLLAWLDAHRDGVKFVVTSVPFASEIINTDDKWCSFAYRPQREQILEHICEQGIGGLVFLTGDMHNSYHAVMTLRGAGAAPLVIHELMSSPINQLGKQSRSRYRTGEEFELANGWTYSTTFPSAGGREEFFTGHSNAMHVRVSGRTVDYAVFRTKKTRIELAGSFTV